MGHIADRYPDLAQQNAEAHLVRTAVHGDKAEEVINRRIIGESGDLSSSGPGPGFAALVRVRPAVEEGLESKLAEAKARAGVEFHPIEGLADDEGWYAVMHFPNGRYDNHPMGRFFMFFPDSQDAWNESIDWIQGDVATIMGYEGEYFQDPNLLESPEPLAA